MFLSISKPQHSITCLLVKTGIHTANETSPWADLQGAPQVTMSFQVCTDGHSELTLDDILNEHVDFSPMLESDNCFPKS